MDELKVEIRLRSWLFKEVDGERTKIEHYMIWPSAAIMETWTEVEGAVIKLVLSKSVVMKQMAVHIWLYKICFFNMNCWKIKDQNLFRPQKT